MRFSAAAFVGALLLAAPAFAAPAFAAPSVLSGKWRIVQIAGAEGFDAARTRAEFSANGRFASTVGCNRIAGMPQVSGEKIAFGRMMMTRMACPGALDETERAYLAALRDVRGWRVEGETLTFFGPDGAALVALERAE